MRLVLSTWKDVEEYLTRSKGIIIPIGATEQHGPGPIGTDAICAETIATELGEATDTLVAPTIWVGMSVHHTAFPGSMTLRPSTLMNVIMDYVRFLERHGFERFYFVNGHGGNMPTMMATFWELYGTFPEMGIKNPERIRLKAQSWWEAEGLKDMSEKLFGDKEGAHATPSEISITQYAYPEDGPKMAPQEDTVDTRRTDYGPADFRKSFPDGRLWSDPGLATPEHGKALCQAAVTAMAKDFAKFMSQE